MQDVPELIDPVRHLPRMHQSIGATSSMVHVELTRSGAGIGLLPCYLADRARVRAPTHSLASAPS